MEDDPGVVDAPAPAAEGEAALGAGDESVAPVVDRATVAPALDREEVSDTGGVLAEVGQRTDDAVPSAFPDWDSELSAHRIIVELKRVEAEVRTLLGDRDPKRKRKLAGTSRWLELEEDLIAWRFGGRFDEAILAQLSALVTRRHHLSRRLRFLASTRPTWNT